MSSASGVSVSFDTVSRAQSDVSNSVARMNQQHADLRTFVTQLTGTWEGKASSDYQVLQKRWDTAAQDLNAVLAEISQVLGQAHDGYRSTESANANAWA
jgi:6 kDa early secretory antigenic target